MPRPLPPRHGSVVASGEGSDILSPSVQCPTYPPIPHYSPLVRAMVALEAMIRNFVAAGGGTVAYSPYMQSTDLRR